MDEIISCKRCELFRNQNPLLDDIFVEGVMWLGLSAKKIKEKEYSIPLARNTNSGEIINIIEKRFEKINFYKSNLVKCVPLNNNRKLRYPNKEEMKKCFINFKIEVKKINPKIVFLLGKKVSEFILNTKIDFPTLEDNFIYKDNIKNELVLVPIHHPSYIYIYKKKYIENYINAITKIINNHLNE